MKYDLNALQTEVEEHIDEIAQQVTELLASSELSFSDARLVLQKAWEYVGSLTVTITDPRN